MILPTTELQHTNRRYCSKPYHPHKVPYKHCFADSSFVLPYIYTRRNKYCYSSVRSFPYIRLYLHKHLASCSRFVRLRTSLYRYNLRNPIFRFSDTQNYKYRMTDNNLFLLYICEHRHKLPHSILCRHLRNDIPFLL